MGSVIDLLLFFFFCLIFTPGASEKVLSSLFVDTCASALLTLPLNFKDPEAAVTFFTIDLFDQSRSGESRQFVRRSVYCSVCHQSDTPSHLEALLN